MSAETARHGSPVPGWPVWLTGMEAARIVSILLITLSLLTALPSVATEAEDEQEWAAQDFQSYCAPCHGLDASGGGPVAEVLKVRPPDLTAISRNNGGKFPAETLYKKIEGLDMPQAHGTSEMPVWGMWFTHQAIGESILLNDAKPAADKVRNRIRAIVGYLESIQK